MGEIYGLYSTRDGQVRYVGQTEYTTRKSLDQIITKALEREPGALFDWIQTEWRDEHDVRARILQDDVIPADLEIFETYWTGQFAQLISEGARDNSGQTTTQTGQRIHDAILADLRGDD